MSWFEVAAKLDPLIKKGETEKCAAAVAKELGKLARGPFHQVLSLEFTNPPQKVAKHFDDFLRAEKKQLKVKAVYAETNGFDINPGRWFFDVFAFSEHGGHEDYDWLADWESDVFESLTLTGMESLQKVYASKAFRDSAHGETSGLCSLLVVIRFQDLIRRSVPFMTELDAPILATSHDYEFIAQFQRQSSTPRASKPARKQSKPAAKRGARVK